ncbi:MAG: undecaprenyl/decaprenyl-phosphate alpha-N-acetylglucosaminyl 1-phosphate transferase [Phycisphaerae bacterium]|nr:undecaprenyl/decaprenyl-phosphate alpha-N-acetylglucosaminyl 1-phosphate transferase [Phycisphaerae bacterium]
MLAPVLALAGVSFILSVMLTDAARRIGRRRLLLDSPGATGQQKVRRNVPNIGGIAIFWSIALPMIAGIASVWIGGDTVARLIPAAAVHLDGIRSQTPMALGLLAALFALHLLGLADDRRPMPAWPKFAVMLLVAAALVLTFDVRLLTCLDAYGSGKWLSISITILWFIAITNAMNFMDNMDGLSAGVGAVASAMFLVAALLNQQWFVSATLALLLGSLCGFLVFNTPRRGGATIFMGDGGSLVLGFLLAFLTVRTTFVPATQATASLSYAVLMPLCILAVPLYDLVTVILIRLSQGRSPLVGDRQHFSHRLLAAGLTVPRALAVICGCTAITGISGIMLSIATGWQALLIATQVFLVLAVIALYEHGKGWPDSLPRAAEEGRDRGIAPAPSKSSTPQANARDARQ